MWKRYVLPVGRLGRGGFWLGFVVLAALYVAINLTGWPWQVLCWPLLWPWFCVFVNRLHDKNHTGWRLLIPIILNIVLAFGVMVALSLSFASGFHRQGDTPSNLPAPLFFTAIGIGALICLYDLCYLLWIGLTPGTAGDNRFGPRAGRSPGA